ncbi:MAG: hypothetical protein PHF11_04855 [Candidatus Omnitrophica bacterium]|nr:hypothetical protein [Candidatus Omnitrophota bacterium]
MGVTYKLKPEIRDFIIKQKEADPLLSCRKLCALVTNKFQVKISKSHINAVIKAKGLSSRVGRKPKVKKGIIEGAGLGAYMLKAADTLIGGTDSIAELIRSHLPNKAAALSLAEALIYLPLFEGEVKAGSALRKLAENQFYDQEALSSYIEQFQPLALLNDNIRQAFDSLLEEVLFLKITFSDNTSFNIDGQLRTLWSSPNIPYDFSATPHNIKLYIKRFIKEETFVLFTAPGYDLFPTNWLDFLLKCGSADKKIVGIDLMGINAKQKEKVTFSTPRNCNIVFALWPWQYLNYRQLESASLSSPYTWRERKINFYLADGIMKLSQHFTNQSVALRSLILRKTPEAKPEFFILTNIPKEKATAEDITNMYLSRWPALQNGFKEFSRRIELFTYNASARQTFPKAKLFDAGATSGFKESLKAYLAALDTYVRWYFLPAEYKQSDLMTTKARFYSLKAQVKKKSDLCTVTFILPEDYSYRKDISYALERMNERQIMSRDGRMMWFDIK